MGKNQELFLLFLFRLGAGEYGIQSFDRTAHGIRNLLNVDLESRCGPGVSLYLFHATVLTQMSSACAPTRPEADAVNPGLLRDFLQRRPKDSARYRLGGLRRADSGRQIRFLKLVFGSPSIRQRSA